MTAAKERTGILLQQPGEHSFLGAAWICGSSEQAPVRRSAEALPGEVREHASQEE
jgi:hypothetical protein